ncbi:MAG TPA: HAD family hydrolase [Clostridiaceae bacterium]|nr:HAD family hydrolase [Clostridiaceae bacterium]
MHNVILFDLDGTLLPWDTDEFISKYFKDITSYFKDMIEPEVFFKHFMHSIDIMMKNQGNMSNEEAFMNSFIPAIGKDKEAMYGHFFKFYEKEFPKLKSIANYSSLPSRIVQNLVEKGYNIVLASNPVFPLSAMLERMSWVGVDKFPWRFITTYENSYYCKPNINYYKDICHILNVSPNNCLMIGNDVQDDMIASSIGMGTFLVTDYMIDRGNPQFKPNYQGTLEDLYEFVKQMPDIK